MVDLHSVNAFACRGHPKNSTPALMDTSALNEVLHAPLFDEDALQANLLRAYRPGGELGQ